MSKTPLTILITSITQALQKGWPKGLSWERDGGKGIVWQVRKNELFCPPRVYILLLGIYQSLVDCTFSSTFFPQLFFYKNIEHEFMYILYLFLFRKR